MSERIYGFCTACGGYVYRIPGIRHGDGQTDTNETPIWLSDSGEDMSQEQIEQAEANEINCGCND